MAEPLKFNDYKPKARPGTLEYSTEWFYAQPEETQKELILQGLAPEAREGDGNYTFEVNPDHQAYAATDEPYEEVTGPQDQRTYTEDEVQEVIRRVVMSMQMSESPDCLFQARCILIAFGIGDPPTETELAKQKGCSRQFVSKKVKRIQQMFNLSPSQFMRSEAACTAYARAWAKHNAKSNAPAIKRNGPAKGVVTKGASTTLKTNKDGSQLELGIANTQSGTHPLVHPTPPPSPPSKESIIRGPRTLGR